MNRRLQDLSRRHCLVLLLAFFLVATLIRLPNLGRPLSKHHEFVDATTLIPIQAWRQAGGAATFHFIPVVNYQNPGDRRPDSGINMDDKGNQLYLSVGPGSYILAYLFLQTFHLPAAPIPLRIFNLLWSLITLFLCFIFFERLLPDPAGGRYVRILIACTLFLFSPCMLWFTGNVYHQTAIMMPFVLIALCLLMPMLDSARTITAARLSATALSILALIYFDWFAAPLCLPVAAYALFRCKKQPKYLLLAVTVSLAVVTGMALIFWQFSGYVGSHKVAVYWYERFLFRSGRSSVPASLQLLKDVFLNLCIDYGPILLLLLVNAGIRLRNRLALRLSPGQKRFTAIYTFSLAAYAFAFLNWTANHDFALVPASLLVAWLATISIPPSLAPRQLIALLLLTLFASVAQYYFINRPGPVSRSGMRYDEYAEFGKRLRNLPAAWPVFSDLPEYCPMCEYYAGRQIIVATNPDSARAWLTVNDFPKGVWVEASGFQFVKLDTLSPENPETKKPARR
jgi:hypothetical protein